MSAVVSATGSVFVWAASWDVFIRQVGVACSAGVLQQRLRAPRFYTYEMRRWGDELWDAMERGGRKEDMLDSAVCACGAGCQTGVKGWNQRVGLRILEQG